MSTVNLFVSLIVFIAMLDGLGLFGETLDHPFTTTVVCVLGLTAVSVDIYKKLNKGE